MNLSSNAKFALLIAEMHEKSGSFSPSFAWKNLLVNPRMWDLPPDAKTERIAENIWLVHLNSELPFLGVLVQVMKDFQIPIRVLFLDSKPDWIKYPPGDEKKSN